MSCLSENGEGEIQLSMTWTCGGGREPSGLRVLQSVRLTGWTPDMDVMGQTAPVAEVTEDFPSTSHSGFCTLHGWMTCFPPLLSLFPFQCQPQQQPDFKELPSPEANLPASSLLGFSFSSLVPSVLATLYSFLLRAVTR